MSGLHFFSTEGLLLPYMTNWRHIEWTQIFEFTSVVIIFLILTQVVYRVWFHPLSKFPGPPLLSVIHFPVLFKHYIRGSWVRQATQIHQKYGRAVRIGPNHLLLDGSLGWKEVYAHRKGKDEFSMEAPLSKVESLMIILSPSESHRRQRRHLSHAFSEAAVLEQESVIRKYVDMFQQRLSARAARKEPVDIVSWFNFVAFDIIGDLAFSESFHGLENNGYHPWVAFIFGSIRGSSCRRFNTHYPGLPWLLRTFNFSSTIKAFNDILSDANDKTLSRVRLGQAPVAEHQDYVSYMLKKTRDGEEAISKEEAAANGPLIIVAGSETVATALSGFCFYTRQNTEAYSILAQEIREAFDREEDITLRNTASLVYLQACINEALRVYPPAAAVMPRISPGDFIDGKYVPAGTMISVYPYSTFHNPDNFTDPDSFIPERWLPPTHPRYSDRFATDNKAAFKPFSFGPRDCIGKNLAHAELRFIIARLLFRFDYELTPGQESWQTDQRIYGLWEKNALYVDLKLRTGHSS